MVLALIVILLGHPSLESEYPVSMNIVVTAGKRAISFELNNSLAAKSLYAQLPLTIAVERYGDNEVIFYPPAKLDVADTPLADARVGTLAYYAPWGDVVMFYDNFGRASGQYKLGRATSGVEHIRGISGSIRIERTSTH